MTTLALAFDSVAALVLAALAAAWLVRRGVRTLTRKGSCDCPSAKGACGAAGSMADDLKAAAARGAARAEAEGTIAPPPR